MTIDWANFTPWSALAGGLMIGLAAGLFILLNGRIAGITGIVAGLLKPTRGDYAWRVAFALGMLLMPVLFAATAELPPIKIEASYPLLIVAGFTVGLSTRYGGGCTSGHGVCGMSRLSPRSIAATLCFMATGFATVFIVRHLIGA